MLRLIIICKGFPPNNGQSNTEYKEHLLIV